MLARVRFTMKRRCGAISPKGKFMKKALPVLCALALTACGTKNVSSKVPTNPPPGKDPNGQKLNCPLGQLPTIESITLLFPHAVPGKIAIRMAGEATPRYNECASGIEPTGLRITSAARPNVTELLVTIDLNHSTDVGGQTVLPATQEFDVLDCTTNTVVSAGKTPMPLTWSYGFPAGVTCQGQVQGSWNGQATPPSAYWDSPNESLPSATPVGGEFHGSSGNAGGVDVTLGQGR
jgi:hypothetical protein